MRNIVIVLGLWSLFSASVFAMIPLKRSDLKFAVQGTLVQENLEPDYEAKVLNKGLGGSWVLGGDIASSSFITLNIKDVQNFKGFSAFTYDVIIDGSINDSNLVGIKRGNIMTFTISFLDGYSNVLAQLNSQGNRAIYTEAYISDRFCEYIGTGSYFLCEFYISEIVDSNQGAMGK